MKTLILTLMLGLSAATAVWANGNPVQQAPQQQTAQQQTPMQFDTGNTVQAQQADSAPAVQQGLALPVMTPAMQRLLMQQAERLAAQQAVPVQAEEATAQYQSNAQRQQ